MIIRRMTLSDLDMVLDWARDEGWNPGRSDATAFFASDPNGFFLVEVDGVTAAAISVVNHDNHHAFLGLYICRKEFRGQGVGFAVWTEALKHAEDRSVTLEGVPDQQENYARSGFRRLGQTVRYAGKIDDVSSTAQVASPEDLPFLIRADQQTVGHERTAFSNRWFETSKDRKTMVIRAGGQPVAYATFRRCAEGAKVGPFFASDETEAKSLLASNPFDRSENLFVDVPTASALLTELLRGMGFQPVFETARMVRGEAALGDLPAYAAVATLELG